jgi:hypothetical protein
MLKRFFFILSVAVVFVACDKRENVRLTAKVDSLNNELMISQ